MLLQGAKRKRFFREARAYLEPFGINWSLYGDPEISAASNLSGRLLVDVYWTRCEMVDGQFIQIILSRVAFDSRTGVILQCGSHYGALMF